MTEPTEQSYVYRRAVSGRELLPALGIAVGAGLFAFYVARILLERTPLVAAPRAARRDDWA